MAGSERVNLVVDWAIGIRHKSTLTKITLTNGNTMDGKNSGMDNPIAGMEPPRSRKKLFIFGGLGCLGLIALVCGGFIALGYFYGLKPMQDFQDENVTLATSMPEVKSALGVPITAGPVVPSQNGSPQSFTFSSNLDGSTASGTLVFVGNLQGTEWVRESIHLEVDGKEVDLDPESIFDLDIDDGQ